MSQVSKNELKYQNSVSFPNNNSGEISPADLRNFNVELIDSTVNQTLYTQDSSSFDGRISSNTTQINSLIAATSSYATSAITASSLVTASFDNGTRNLTFTKGNNTQFSVNIPDVSGSTGNFATTGSNTFVGNQNIQGTITASMQEGFALVGGVGNVSTLVATSSFGGGGPLPSGVVSGSSQLTSSYDLRYALSGSTGTTGSNTFVGNQTITGSLIISSSEAVELQVIGNAVITGSLTISSSAQNDLRVVGKILTTGSTALIENTNGLSSQYMGVSFGGNIGAFNINTADEIGLALDGATWTTNWSNGPILYVNNALGDPYEAAFGFQNKANYTDGRITALKPLIAQQGAQITGSTIISGSTQITGSVDISGAITSSIPTGFFLVGGAGNRTINASTGSFATVFSNTFNGNQIITGSVLVSGSAKQTFNAPTINNQTDIVVVKGATINGVPFNQQTIGVQNYDFGIDAYKNAFVIEAWDSSGYNFGGEALVNGETAQLFVVASGSGAQGTRLGNIAVIDNGNQKVKAVLTGQIIEIGGAGTNTTAAIAESITIGKSTLPVISIASLKNEISGSTIISGSVAISGSLSINNDIFVSSSDIFLTGSGGSFINIFQQPDSSFPKSAIRFYSGSTIDQIGRGGQIRTSGNGDSINIGTFGAGETTLVDFDFKNLQTLFSQNVSVVGSKTLTVSGTGSGEFSSISPRGTISLSSGSSDIVFSAASPLTNTINRAGTTAPILIDIYNVESTLAISITATGSFIQDFSAVTNVNENAIKLQPYSDYQRGQVTILRDLDVSGSTFVSGSVRGNVASASISSNTASLDFGSSNFFTLTLVSGSSTHIVPQNVGTGQTINLKVVQPSVGTGTISFPSSFKFPEVAPYTASIVTSSVDIVTFITFEDTGSIYSIAVKRLV
jgi:hypothetical protein